MFVCRNALRAWRSHRKWVWRWVVQLKHTQTHAHHSVSFCLVPFYSFCVCSGQKNEDWDYYIFIIPPAVLHLWLLGSGWNHIENRTVIVTMCTESVCVCVCVCVAVQPVTALTCLIGYVGLWRRLRNCCLGQCRTRLTEPLFDCLLWSLLETFLLLL